MTKEELEKVVQGAEYDFLRENPHLGSNIMFLTLGGSHAYGTNVPGSDVDVRGVTGDSKYDLLGFGTFEQVVEQSTDTTIYGFRKLVSLLINCNPNVIEILQKYDADSPKAIHEYFSRLYGYKGDGLDKFDIVKMANSKLIPFQDISQKFKIIDEDTVTVIISQTAEASELVGKIRNQTATKDDIRKVGKYAVSVRRSKYDKYLAASTEDNPDGIIL